MPVGRFRDGPDGPPQPAAEVEAARRAGGGRTKFLSRPPIRWTGDKTARPASTMGRVIPESWAWATRDETLDVWPGRHQDLGATWGPEATNFAVSAPDATAVWVCLFDEDGPGGTETRLPADRAHPRRLERSGPGRLRRPALRLSRRRPVGPAPRPPLQPAQAAARPVRPAITGEPTPGSALLDHDGSSRSRSTVDSAPSMPRSVVVHDEFDWGDDRPMRRRWRDTVIYELHVKGFTQLHNEIPEHLRGTYAGLGTHTVTDYLNDLGVTAVELMPVHQFFTEPAVAARGMTNYWGYNSIGFFAPHAAFSSAGRPRPAGDRVQADGQELPRGRHRGVPRRGLQPHGRGRGVRARRTRSAVSTTSGSTSAPAPRAAPTGTSPAAATPSTRPTRTPCG